MSSSSKLRRGKDEYVVVLGGNEAGIYPDGRPPNVATGNYPAYMPIVVTCLNFEDASAVNQINTLIENVNQDDKAALSEVFRTRVVRKILTHVSRFYCFLVGPVTGVWAGHAWGHVEALKSFQAAQWKRRETLRDALLFMLDKELSDDEGEDQEARTRPQTPCNPPSRSQSRPASPTKASAIKQVKFETSPIQRSQSLPCPSPSPSRARAAPSTPALSSRRTKVEYGSSVSAQSPFGPGMESASRSTSPFKRSTSPLKRGYIPCPEDDTFVDADEEAMDLEALRIALELPPLPRAHDPRPVSEAFLQVLQTIIRTPPTPEAIRRTGAPYVIRLGGHAEAFLRGRGATDLDTLHVLQARVHNDTVDGFVYDIAVLLNWPAEVAMQLWEFIELPSA